MKTKNKDTTCKEFPITCRNIVTSKDSQSFFEYMFLSVALEVKTF
jgi:hypothetical protein